jgi:hypothetical protein
MHQLMHPRFEPLYRQHPLLFGEHLVVEHNFEHNDGLLAPSASSPQGCEGKEHRFYVNITRNQQEKQPLLSKNYSYSLNFRSYSLESPYFLLKKVDFGKKNL